MAICRSGLVWAVGFLFLVGLNFIPGLTARRPQAVQGGQRPAATASGGARTPATSPATAPTTRPVQRLRATVVGVEGLAQVRHKPDAPWQRCKVGMVLEEGADFRVGPRSAVRFATGPDNTVTLDRAGVCSLLRAVIQSHQITSDVGLSHGRIHYEGKRDGLPRTYDGQWNPSRLRAPEELLRTIRLSPTTRS